MSRLVNGRAEPSIESLRKLATLWKIPLSEMLIHAGYAEPDELHVIVTPPDDDHNTTPVRIPSNLELTSLERWEKHLWLTPDMTAEQRRGLIRFARLERGELTDDLASLLQLSDALSQIIARHLREHNNGHQAG